MSKPTFTLTHIEAAYVVGALRIVLDQVGESLSERDSIIMHAIMDKLAAPLDLSDAVKARLEDSRGKS